MNLAVSYHPAHPEAVPATSRHAAEIARVEVFNDMGAAEPFWRRLEGRRALLTPYQRFDLLAAWQQHVGGRSGIAPFIVTGFDQGGEPLFLWPLGRAQLGPLRLVRFLGSKHANFNIGLWRRELLADITTADLHGVFSRVADHGIDLAVLCSQPLSWDGIANPFAQLPHQA